jgi:hypothetical protein
VTIHREDLEAKLREIESVVSDAESEARNRSMVLLIGAAVVVVGFVAYRIWSGRRDKIRVEVYHQS